MQVTFLSKIQLLRSFACGGGDSVNGKNHFGESPSFLASSICDSAFLPSSCYVILEDKTYY